MYLKDTEILESPIDDSKVRLVGEVFYDNKKIDSERYWFEVPKKYKTFLSNSGNPWLVCLVPLAATLGEPLRLCKPVDSLLFENIQRLMRIWKNWYPHIHVTPIEAEIVDIGDIKKDKKTAAFFSGGVDSFFTVLWHNRQSSDNKIKIDDLLSVWGFDIPLKNNDSFLRMYNSFEDVALEFNVNLISIATNLRETCLENAGWEFYYGAALASVALLLEKRYKKVLIASGGLELREKPRGSHPLTDPLFSTKNTKIIHDAGNFTRVQKTQYIAKSKIARNLLRVCWKGKSHNNCCNCAKCYRTMTTLEALGELGNFNTFNESFSLSKLKRIYLSSEIEISFFNQIRDLALQKGREDIVKAIDECFDHTIRLNKLLFFTKWLKTKRYIRILANKIERGILRGSII